MTNLILCIDESLNCADTDAKLQGLHSVIRYKRRIDANAVLKTVETMLGTAKREQEPV